MALSSSSVVPISRRSFRAAVRFCWSEASLIPSVAANCSLVSPLAAAVA